MSLPRKAGPVDDGCIKVVLKPSVEPPSSREASASVGTRRAACDLGMTHHSKLDVRTKPEDALTDGLEEHSQVVNARVTTVPKRRIGRWLWGGLAAALVLIVGSALVDASSADDRGSRGPADQASDAPQHGKERRP